MKKRFLFIFIMLIFVGFLTACEEPTCKHVDKDDNLKCDICGEDFDDGEDKPTEDEYEIKIISVSAPASFVTWNSNKGEQTNKQTEFMVLNQQYLVGDDNDFIVKPRVSFVKVNKESGATLPAAITEWNYIINVYLVEGSNETNVTENAEYIEEINKTECTIDFAEKAIGKEFRIEVRPEGLTEEQIANESNTIEFAFKVVDGFNAYNALDLAYIEGREYQYDEEGKKIESKEVEAWLAFKEEHELDVEYQPSAIILHNDIKITPEDVPTYFFWQKDEVSVVDADYNRVIGSMKDNRDFYCRDMEENEQFKLIGNYFQIDNSDLKVIVREYDKITPEGQVISHTSLFKFRGAGTADVTFENLRIIGNSGRTENIILSGGQILIKVIGPQMLAYNNISVNTFIHYFAEHNDDKVSNDNTTIFTIEKCKGYDAFNSFLHNWGSHMIIKDSELIGAGGPAIVQDYCTADIAGGKPHAPKVEIYNSRVESFVAGSEGWFKLVKSDALIPGIKQLSQIFQPVGRTFVIPNEEEDPAKQVTFFNLISVVKSGDAESYTSVKVDGTLIKDSYTFDYGLSASQNGNPFIKAVLDQTFEYGAPAFETNNGGLGYFDGAQLLGADSQPIADPTNPIFTGDTISLYYMGMMLTFGYYNVGDVHTTK